MLKEKMLGKEESLIETGIDLGDLLETKMLIYDIAKNYKKDSAPSLYAIKNQEGTDILTERRA